MGIIPDDVYCFDINCQPTNNIKECYQMYIAKETREIISFICDLDVFTTPDDDYIGFWFKDNTGMWWNMTALENECLKGI